jgi:CRP/FNR family transcriptional regulator, nitrogen oxide reductase regulator
MPGKKPMTPDPTLLGRVPLFQGLAPDALAEIVRAAQSRHFAKGKTVFEQDAPATAFFVVLHGEIKVAQMTREGQQVVVRYVGPGEFMGCAALMGRAAYPGTASAVTDSVLLCWDAAATARLIERHRQVAVNALGVVGERLYEAHARLRELATERVERRIARALLRLAQQAGSEGPDGIEILFPLTRQDVAEMTGTTLHTVSRVLSGWEERGILAGGRQKITILDPHRLVLLAEDLQAAAEPPAQAKAPLRRA